MSDIERRLTDALSGRRFALVGAGQLGEMALALWPNGVPQPEFVLDSTRRGTIGGIDIHDLKAHRPVPGVTYLLSAFKMPTPDVEGIFRSLEQSLILTVYDLFEHYSAGTFSNGWRNLGADDETRARLSRLGSLYADQLSAEICAAVEDWRYRRILRADYPVAPESGKYDLRSFDRGGIIYDHIYDCGSFDLGLLGSLAKAEVRFGDYVAFEADPANRRLCANRLLGLDPSEANQILVDPRAISDRAGQRPFLANGQLSARLVADSVAETVACRQASTATLDAVHADHHGWSRSRDRRVLVKLHVEGAEPDALIGAERLLAETRADLLINMSHDERSLLDIPEQLAASGQFDLFLRSHSLFGEGLTLFARNRH